MRGSPWVTFHRDWYLDLRRPEWAHHERTGHVKFQATGAEKFVCVHSHHASHIVDALALRPTSAPTSYATASDR